MPITHNVTLPESADDLTFPPGTDTLFVVWLASIDPATNKAWCPDVVAAMPALNTTFSGENAPSAIFVDAGHRPEWKDHNNRYRTKWNVHNVPTLVRYGKNDGKVIEVGRLVEGEILNEARLQALVSGRS